MPNTVSATYHARDGRHEVVVERAPSGRWRVLDISRRSSVIVDELFGHDDGYEQADILARDYAAEMADYQAGLRLEHPLPPRRSARRRER